MSKTFRNFLYELRYVFPKYLQFIISGVGLGGHALYSYGTYNTSTIQIQKMYKYNWHFFKQHKAMIDSRKLYF